MHSKYICFLSLLLLVLSGCSQKSNENIHISKPIVEAKVAQPTTKLKNEMSPLHFAVIQKDINKVRKIIYSNKGIVNAKDSEGETAIMYAAKKCYFEIFEILVSNGAEYTEYRSKELMTAVDYARKHKCNRITQKYKNKVINIL